MFGHCKVCVEKEKHLATLLNSVADQLKQKDSQIDDLRMQISYLRKLAIPARQNTALPVVHLERDKLLNGDSDVTEYTSKDGVFVDAETPDFPDADVEANALLTGNF